MSDALVVPRHVTVEEYLAHEETRQMRHEFVDGVLFGMTGGSDRHNELVGELLFALRSQLPAGCKLYMLDMKLKVKIGKSTRFYYPDVMVSCSSTDRATHFKKQPSLLMEVLSPSTERTDRTEKFNAYTQIPSLQEYLLVAQDVPRIELFRRSEGWQREEHAREHTVTLASVGAEFSVQQLYSRVGF